MERDEASRRIDSLRAQVRAARHAYYVLDNPSLADAEFDAAAPAFSV